MNDSQNQPQKCVMSAGDLLRQALEDAPALRVERDGWEEYAVWDGEDAVIIAQGDIAEERIEGAVMRLLGLLLAAAPRLADLLDTSGGDVDPAAMYAVKRAIEEAAR